jgi:hypothetical protein
VQAIEAMLDDIGETVLEDFGAETDVRAIRASASAPLSPPFEQALFEYFEIYERRSRSTWELSDYSYEFQQRPPPGRRAYHQHDPQGVHAHCVDPRGPERDHHYRGVKVSVFEAHAEFLQWFAGGSGVNCIGLFPLFAEEPS